MPHVIGQSCCNDSSCVFACPVNCIHPSPDEPGFATTEMLYIDPDACVDCGACVRACPVDAIAPDTQLSVDQLPFIAINASFYPERPPGTKLPPTSKLAPVLPAPELRRGPLSVAIVGSGPAAMYAADELLTQPRVRVSMFEKLPTPYGLVRAGVAPDHQSTKRVTKLFDQICDRDGFSFYLNVEVGQHIGHHELLAHHHAVIYAVGAPTDRRLDIEGMDLPGTGTATELVAWINGHPDFTDLPVDLSHERVVIVGNGNVALDVARVLAADPEKLARTDISDHALAALRTSGVREVVIAARRGPAQSAFTLPELIGLTGAADVVLDAADHELVRRDLAEVTDRLTRNKLEILTNLPEAADVPLGCTARPRIRFVYQRTPHRIRGAERATGIEFTVTGTEQTVDYDAGLILTSIGYRGLPIRDLPFDEASATVPNEGGRVLHAVTGARIPGAYVAGWIKRGPTGFIGTNKSCSMQTVQQLVDDFNADLLPDPVGKQAALDRLLKIRQPDLIDVAGWQAIDAAEITRGEAEGRPRHKFTSIEQMVNVAAAAPKPTLRQRISAKIHELV
ncbi:FAD-dependent oxidoreductase [Mycobacterium sp. 1274756.6]|uniref:FAD-dependent oxidoreductase n=1 Tax=Mycobacterium sp. 1274756.6 TaxID=1834076 RepID=UPI0007FFDB3E|nr:FAD-dependent oxidoreductase [Mycobacterium sp. 1274756.6]OBJ68050.1 ferredoxin [Mycobacterium sp. 1274756.6]